MEPEAPKIAYRLPPEEVIIALSGILEFAIASIRGAASPEYAEYCWELAYHVHNIPNLIRHYNRGGLEWYLKFFPGQFTRQFEERFHHPPTELIPYWEQLEAYLEKTKDEGT